MARVMGIVNVTPDSFSDGNLYYDVEKAIKHGQQLLRDGADIIDIGGESTRPGADRVGVHEELERVIPVIEGLLHEQQCTISIDTSKPEVMRAAVAAGADMINDVCALRKDGALATAAELDVSVCLMHMHGKPQTMQMNPRYDDVVADVIAFLRERVQCCHQAGIDRRKLIVDPGIGFGKSDEHNLRLLAAVERIRDETDSDVLIGVSRKSIIGHLTDKPPLERDIASVALALQAVFNGASIVRVHDVAATVEALTVVSAVQNYA